MTIEIQIPRKVSLNSIYSGIHFRQRAAHKEEYRWAVLAAKPKNYTGAFPVHISMHFRLSGNAFDIDNHAYMAKMVIDGLVACDVLPQDDQRYIAALTMTTEKIKKGEDDVVVVHISTAAVPD